MDGCHCFDRRSEGSCRVGKTPTVGEEGEKWMCLELLSLEEGCRHPAIDEEVVEEDGWSLPRSSAEKVEEL